MAFKPYQSSVVDHCYMCRRMTLTFVRGPVVMWRKGCSLMLCCALWVGLNWLSFRVGLIVKYVSGSENEDETAHAPKPKSGVRGFARRRKKTEAVKEHPVQSGFYSGCVTKCFNQIRAHTLSEEMKHALEDEGDVEDDLLLRCSKKKDLPPIPSSDALLVISDDEEKTENCPNLGNSSEENVNMNTIKSPSPPPPPPPQAQGRKRTRATKQKKNLMNAVDNYTKSLSAAEKELKASQQIQEPEVCVINDDDVVTVRVDHRGSVCRFTIKPDDPMSIIISQIAKKESVEEKCVMLVHKDKTLKPTDSPYTADLQIADIIECHITSSLEDSLNESSCEQDDPNIIELVVQSQGSKHRELVKAHINKPVSTIISEYAKRVKKDAACLQFVFDGEELAPEQTPKMLEMEEGDILDVKEVNDFFMRVKKSKLGSHASQGHASQEIIHIV
ncbi:NFATC2-interacting protein-like [Mercenaria mercenaria]|uniref:NFATC2-interacting protein-like n=1 Tax=Mercenaria mercenaria TaxID=6596 RepID=UPI00234F9EFC|nr:NFATC2-interacting protein-like [Mercenaria mercenaria]